MTHKLKQRCNDDNQLLNEIFILFFVPRSFSFRNLFSLTHFWSYDQIVLMRAHLIYYCLNVTMLDFSRVVEVFYFIHERQKFFISELLVLFLLLLHADGICIVMSFKLKRSNISSSCAASIFSIHDVKEVLHISSLNISFTIEKKM